MGAEDEDSKNALFFDYQDYKESFKSKDVRGIRSMQEYLVTGDPNDPCLVVRISQSEMLIVRALDAPQENFPISRAGSTRARSKRKLALGRSILLTDFGRCCLAALNGQFYSVWW